MKHLVQYTEDELVRLLQTDLSQKGHKIVPADFAIEFVKTSSGMSALVSGVLGTNVQELDTQEGVDEESDVRRVAWETVRVALNKEGRTIDDFVALVLDEVEELGLHMELDEDETAKQVRVYILMLLQKLEKEGVAEYVDLGDLWRKKARKGPKKLSKVTTLSAAAQILGGEGGVLDRSDALGEGVSEESPRVPTRRGKAGSRGGRGNGSPFQF